MQSNKHKRQETQRIFLGETIKEKTPQLRDRINTKSKTRKHKDDLPTVVVSLLSQQLLSHSCAPMSECVCVINREAHSLFIFFRSLNVHSNMSALLNNYLLEPTSLGESNNPSAPQLVGMFPLRPTRRVILNTMVRTIAPTYNNSSSFEFSRIV